MIEVEKAVKKYFKDMAKINDTEIHTDELSFYRPLGNLLNDVGATMIAPVECVEQPRTGTDRPDFLLLGDEQGARARHGAIEAKGLGVSLSNIFGGRHGIQMRKYLASHELLTVTNYREFHLFKKEDGESLEPLETLSIADNEEQFWKIAEKPQKAAREHGVRIWEFLRRSLAHSSFITNPKDVAWFLSSYAREALAKIESVAAVGTENPLKKLRKELEEGLGDPFKSKNKSQGNRLFCSTLAQTLFYGMFSAWVTHARDEKRSDFDWKSAQHKISIPVLQHLYAQLTTPAETGRLGLKSILDKAEKVLNRIDQKTFFENFESGNAIQHFYQPFLKEFDPASQVKLGVYYTPPEVIEFMVERVDRVLKEELKIKKGLADEQVHVLDPCCGTGAYIIAVLKKIWEAYPSSDHLAGAKVKKAATTRIWGFEIMPAPFLVAHWRVQEFLKKIKAPKMLDTERAKIILTNALMGWNEDSSTKDLLSDLQEEHDLASEAKQDARILVVIGNPPPYSADSGSTPFEDKDLTSPYKDRTKKLMEIQRSNLNDLYVKFFRIAETRIEKEGRGIVAYITSDSWLSKKSFIGMRAHLLETFNKAWVEKMPGSIFKIKGFAGSIKQGVATSLLLKNNGGRGGGSEQSCRVLYRDIKGRGGGEKIRKQLLASLSANSFDAQYGLASPADWNLFTLQPIQAPANYLKWPSIAALCKSKLWYAGLKEGRGGTLYDDDKEALIERMKTYHDSRVSWQALLQKEHGLTRGYARFKAEEVRKNSIKRGYDANAVIEYARLPFDNPWSYYTNVPGVWNEHRPGLWKQQSSSQRFLASHESQDKELGHPATFTTTIGDSFLLSDQTELFPFFDHVPAEGDLPELRSANLSKDARLWLERLGLSNPDSCEEIASMPWFHVLAVCYSAKYISTNHDILKINWPRIPMPNSRDTLEKSANLGREVASLLNPRKEPLVSLAYMEDIELGAVQGMNLALKAGWGYLAKGKVQAGKGKIAIRKWDIEERKIFRKVFSSEGIIEERGFELLGKATDIYLNEKNYWKGIPENALEYKIGRHPVIKKWLSYREKEIIGRDLNLSEVEHFTEMVQHITALILMRDRLDRNYEECCDNAYEWPVK